MDVRQKAGPPIDQYTTSYAMNSVEKNEKYALRLAIVGSGVALICATVVALGSDSPFSMFAYASLCSIC